MPDQIQTIEIRYDYEESSMFGINGAEGYDYQASCDKFETMLEAALAAAYPGVEIAITKGAGQYLVDGSTSHDEADAVGHVLHEVWSGFDWLVEDASDE